LIKTPEIPNEGYRFHVEICTTQVESFTDEYKEEIARLFINLSLENGSSEMPLLPNSLTTHGRNI
jgi:hypothetical protein